MWRPCCCRSRTASGHTSGVTDYADQGSRVTDYHGQDGIALTVGLPALPGGRPRTRPVTEEDSLRESRTSDPSPPPPPPPPTRLPPPRWRLRGAAFGRFWDALRCVRRSSAGLGCGCTAHRDRSLWASILEPAPNSLRAMTLVTLPSRTRIGVSASRERGRSGSRTDLQACCGAIGVRNRNGPIRRSNRFVNG